MTEVVPWQHVGDDPPGEFFDTPDAFLSPGALAHWHREQARVAAEEAREAAERQERADARRAVAEWTARQSAISRGLPWSPERPFEHEPSIYAKADMVFQLQDAQARAADLAAAQEAGLVHLLHQGVPSTPEEPEPLEPPGPSGSAARGVPLVGPPDTSTPAGKARAALRRWSARERRQRVEQR